VLAARLAERAGAANKLTDARRFARTIMEEIRMATPEHHRAGLERIPTRSGRWAGRRPVGTAPSRRARWPPRAGCGACCASTSGSTASCALPRLLEMIVDTVIELTDAERGFLLLEDEPASSR
jgi:hypothetical protein